MIRIRQIKLNIDENENNLKQKISQKLKIKENDILTYKIKTTNYIIIGGC